MRTRNQEYCGGILDFDSIHYPAWVQFMPFIKRSYSKFVFNKILDARTEIDVARQWSECHLRYEHVLRLSNIIADQCFWRNSLFIPSDSCDVVFWESVDMGPAHALAEMSLESWCRSFDVIVDVYQRSKGMEYRDFLNVVLASS